MDWAEGAENQAKSGTPIIPHLTDATSEAEPDGERDYGGMNARHILSTGLAALPVNAASVLFDCSHVYAYARGNLAGDVYANVTAEAIGRILAVRLYNMTNDPGMRIRRAF